MRIPRFRSPTLGLAFLVSAIIACICAVADKPLEIRAVAATTKAKTGKRLDLKSAISSSKTEQTITLSGFSSKSFGDQPFQASAIASSGLIVTLTAAGHCSVVESTIYLTGVGSCTITATQEGNDDYNAAPSVSRSFFIGNLGETVLDLSDFGATGDGVTDDAPAFQQALNALANAGGGTLFVPTGRFVLATPVAKVFTGLASSIAIRGVESNTLVDTTVAGVQLASGLGLSSEIYPRTNEQIGFIIAGLKTLLVADIAFVGTPGVETDAAITLYLGDVAEATVHHCEFYGLRTGAPGAGILFAYRSALRIEQSKFLGTSGDSSVNTPVVQNIEWKSISLSDVVFADYGLRPELYCKCGATYSWVTVGNAAATTADSPRREASFRNVFMDEGALTGLFSLPSSFQPTSAPIDLIYISKLRMNVSNLVAWGNYLTGVERVLIEDSKYEWSHNASAAIQLIDAGKVIIDQTECLDAANRIAADNTTQKLTVINSTYAYLDSQAQTTKTLVVSAEEDPVQYVRTQFEQILGRSPDPAAHFYWSELMLECDGDPGCVLSKRSELAQYLGAMPSANFSITGQINNEQGSPLTGVVVALSGSQSATTQTDGDGKYSFVGLPTSGIYKVTPSRAHYTFQDPERTITTPAGDQTINFDAVHNRYQISGRVANGQGTGISGVTVALSGAESGTTSTDGNGNYSLTVEAEKNYTVTPSKAHYTFDPALKTINANSGNETVNFTGTLFEYVLSGSVTNNGAGLGGVTVALSGSQTSGVITGADGNFSFGVTAEGTYTIAPALTHYTFSPTQKIFSNVSANGSVIFGATLNTHVISGIITNANGEAQSNVTVTLSGGKSATATTDTDGKYLFSNLSAGLNYTATPARTHYTFNPASQTFTDLGADGQRNFVATLNTHEISGTITNASGGVLSNATVTLSGGKSATATTDTAGKYLFSNLSAGLNYTMTPAKTHYTFNPASQIFSNLSANVQGNFVATLNTHEISGTITNASGGVLSNATVTLSGGKSATATTDTAGKYLFSNLSAGLNYTVTPAKTNYTFSPSPQSFTNLGANAKGDFTAVLNQHVISGRVTNASGAGIPGVTMTLSGSQSAAVTTNASGAYSFANLPAGGNYTVISSKANYSFGPASSTLTNLSQDHVADFTGSLVNYVLSGRVTNDTEGLSGVAVALGGSQTGSAVTDANGDFSFNVLAEGSYTIAPVLKHFSFTPQLVSYSNVSANSSGNFVAALNTHTISGHVTKANSEMPSVTIALSGSQSATMTTDVSGAYSFSNLPAGGNYTITPSLTNFEFEPTNKSFTDLCANQTTDFSAAPKTTIEFSNASYSVTESTSGLIVTINRVGDTTGVSTVDFTTVDDAGLQDCNVTNGKASPRCDFSFTIATVQFAAGQTSTTISIPIINGVYVEGSETFTIRLTNPIGALIAEADSATVTITDNDSGSGLNPVSDTDFFIRQHYLDFLGREPDPAGFEGWRNILKNCGITVPQPCDQIEVSSAFFRSAEFQGRGYFVYRFYPIVGKVPLYDQFAVDMGALSGFLTPEQLEAKKLAFTAEFMDRPEFHSKYDALASPAAYVDGLLQTVNLPSHPSRQSWIDGLTSSSLTRAEVLRALADSTEMYQKYYNEAFVVMQYFGYLRRTADASYLQWIQTMNSNGGDYRVMVSGFLKSLEYRQRFGP